jgi:hypothetical protein
MMDTDNAFKVLISTVSGLRLTREERVVTENAIQQVINAVAAERASTKKEKPNADKQKRSR